MKKYDFLIVGAGLFGCVFAQQMKAAGKTCMVIDRRSHIGGNAYTEETEGIQVHMYGPHIFHTSDLRVWKYINQFAEFNHFRYEPLANYRGEIYSLPFNMNTFHQMWNIRTPQEAKKIMDEQRREIRTEPADLEEQAISLVGRDIYEKLIRGYTEKQWGRSCKHLPAFVIKRLPVRFTYNNNYYNDKYQGIPIGGYAKLMEKMLDGIDVVLETDYMNNRDSLDRMARMTVYTGAIDEYYQYCCGQLEYRGLRFETRILDTPNYQGVAGVNYTDYEVPYTRSVEHKHFEFGDQEKTVVTWEYAQEWHRGEEPYYPVNNDRNQEILLKYQALAQQDRHVIFGGRLGEYKYYNMDEVIRKALDKAKEWN